MSEYQNWTFVSGVNQYILSVTQVRVYDIKASKLVHTLEGHTWRVTCMNMLDSPVNELVTGCLDKQ